MKLERKCDFCDHPAVADGKTRMGCWAYMCEDCLKKNGYPASKYFVTYIDGRNDRKEATSNE